MNTGIKIAATGAAMVLALLAGSRGTPALTSGSVAPISLKVPVGNDRNGHDRQLPSRPHVQRHGRADGLLAK